VLLGQIRHAGAIFLGRFSPEPVGDYFAGPNHVLPTNGTARFSSPLNVEDFQKKSSILLYSEKALRSNGEKIAAFARLEGLEAHARSIETRLRK
jgi:histidinol dehydrogenase